MVNGGEEFNLMGMGREEGGGGTYGVQSRELKIQ